MHQPSVLVDCCNELVGEPFELCGRARILCVQPVRATPLNKKGPHRHDVVGRVFVLEGRSADGKTWIYRERYWETAECDCQSAQR